MRNMVTMAAMAVLTAGSAMAADLPFRSAPPPFVAPLPVFTWTGGYIGINAGYAFDYRDRFTTFDDPTVPVTGAAGAASGSRPGVVGVKSDGFTGGGQVGYNYQFGAGNGIVVGLEADAAYTDLGQTDVFTLTSPGGVTRVSAFHTDMDFLGTVRGRVGYGFDRFLVYGTGGFAYGDVSSNTQFFLANGTTLTYAGGRSGIDTGYAYGGGVEYALPTGSLLNFLHSSAVTIKAEYIHYDLGSHTYAAPATGLGGAGNTGVYTQRVQTDGDLVRAGINYKF